MLSAPPASPEGLLRPAASYSQSPSIIVVIVQPQAPPHPHQHPAGPHEKTGSSADNHQSGYCHLNAPARTSLVSMRNAPLLASTWSARQPSEPSKSSDSLR